MYMVIYLSSLACWHVEEMMTKLDCRLDQLEIEWSTKYVGVLPVPDSSHSALSLDSQEGIVATWVPPNTTGTALIQSFADLHLSGLSHSSGSPSYSRQSRQDHHSCQCWSFSCRNHRDIAWNFLWGSAHQHFSSFLSFLSRRISSFHPLCTEGYVDRFSSITSAMKG